MALCYASNSHLCSLLRQRPGTVALRCPDLISWLLFVGLIKAIEFSQERRPGDMARNLVRQVAAGLARHLLPYLRRGLEKLITPRREHRDLGRARALQEIDANEAIGNAFPHRQSAVI